MGLTEYLGGIARRWKVVLACLIVALAVGWLLSPNEPSHVEAPSTGFTATTYLLSTSTSFGVRGGGSLDTVAALATLGEVPRRVADTISFDGDPAALAATVSAVPDDTTQLLNITARAPTAARAKLVADTFANELIGFLSDRTTVQVESLRRQIDRLDRRIARLTDQLPPPAAGDSGIHSTVPSTGGGEGSQIQAQIDSLDGQRQILQQQLTNLSTDSGGNLAGYEVVEPATATRVATDPGIQAPRSRTIRLAIAGGIGLLLGIALALLLERFDTRIRRKPAAEDAYGLPVLAVIPSTGRRRRAALLMETAPRGPAANAFRLLAASLQLGWQQGSPGEGQGDAGFAHTVLVTSGEPREGRSTVAANLAATFAENGKRVVVVGADYRHPTLHAALGVALEPGLTEFLEGGAVRLESVLQDTALEGLRVISTGRVPNRTAGLFGSDRVQELLAALRSSADVIVVDTSPVLTASDWTQLIPSVDAVIVVARAGATDAGSARRTAEVLGLLKAPVTGVILNGVARGLIRQATDRSRYRYQAPARDRSASSKPPAPPVVLVHETNGGAAHGNGEAAAHGNGEATRSDEGIPHLSRPATKE